MVTESFLRNLYKTEYYDYLKGIGYQAANKILKGADRYDYSAIKSFFEEEIYKEESNLDQNAFDYFFYDKLFYQNTNYQYIYSLDEVAEINEMDSGRIDELIHSEELKVDKKIVDGFEENPNSLITTRLSKNASGAIEKINLLYNMGTTDTKRGEANLLAGVIIDLANEFVIFKFNLTTLEYYSEEKKNVLEQLKSNIYELPFMNDIQVNFNSIDETTASRLIFNLFRELSLEAEELINSKIPAGTDEKISEFLKGLELRNTDDDYVKQVRAIVYQDVSKSFEDIIFNNGWVFRFLFREDDKSRASSRTDDFTPIYHTKVYWNLKELIYNKQRMFEAGLLWYLVNDGQYKIPIFVRLEAKNDTIVVQYYKKDTGTRKEDKENYVFRKIRENLLQLFDE